MQGLTFGSDAKPDFRAFHFDMSTRLDLVTLSGKTDKERNIAHHMSLIINNLQNANDSDAERIIQGILSD